MTVKISSPSLVSTIEMRPSEKPQLSEDCVVHGPSQTPTLDNRLQQPQAQEAIRGLTSAEYGGCTRCTTETLAAALATYAKDTRAARNGGELPKEERKVLKKEVKFLLKSVKQDIKKIWKD